MIAPVEYRALVQRVRRGQEHGYVALCGLFQGGLLSAVAYEAADGHVLFRGRDGRPMRPEEATGAEITPAAAAEAFAELTGGVA